MAAERIDPLFFGGQERRLFGCHHGPVTAGAPRRGVVIAAPFGHENSRAHRALRRLALDCAGRGLRALRFDFFACGDSAGEPWPESLEGWVGDLELAQRELLLRARVAEVGLLGVRLAGALALARSARQALNGPLVLWDPVLDGRAFVAQLRAAQEAFVGSLQARPAVGEASADLECVGFSWPAGLIGAIEQLGIPNFERAPAARVLLLESALSAAGNELAGRLERAGASVVHAPSSGSTPWNEDVDRGLVPAADLARIVDFLAQGA